MSRQLPPKANFDYLKKQAKELRAELSGEQPGIQLADAQRLLAREYGFPTWAVLKAHVTETPGRAFAGAWQADVARSKRPPDNLYRSATLRFDVNGDAITITDVVVDESGRQDRNSNTLVVDGRRHEQRYGYAVTARWVTPRHLEATLSHNGEPRGQVAYVVADDGRTLTLSTPDSVSVFDRVG